MVCVCMWVYGVVCVCARACVCVSYGVYMHVWHGTTHTSWLTNKPHQYISICDNIKTQMFMGRAKLNIVTLTCHYSGALE